MSISRLSTFRPLYLVAVLSVLSACTGPAIRDRLPGGIDQLALINDVPFYPQKKYQCGPAALAMMLNYAGTRVTAEQLVPQVYIPERHGSLQIDMTATTRRYGHVPYQIRPELSDLFREINAGHPVLVLQNLGLSWMPTWHYAVVIGYDLNSSQMILHSGEQAEHRVSIKTFSRTWQRAQNWGLVITVANQVPATADQTTFIRAVADLEKMSQWDAARQGYSAARQRWPDSFLATFGLANIEYRLGRLDDARREYQRAIAIEPRAIAYHNLAVVYEDLGKLDMAEQNVLTAIKLGGPMLDTFKQTLAEIRARKKP